MTEGTQTGNLTGELKVHKLIAGPFSASECDPDWDDDCEDYYWIDVMVEYDGHMDNLTIGHNDFNMIYAIVKHLQSPTLEPYIISKTTLGQ